MFQRIFLAGFTVAILCTAANFVHAQSRGGSSAFGSGGMSGGSFNTSMGGGGFGSSSFGSGGFGGSRFGSSGGFGSSGFGGSPFGNSGFSNQGGSRMGQGGQVGQQGFIGRDGGDIQNLFNQLGRGGNQIQNMNGMSGRGNNQGRNRNRGSRSSQGGNQQGKNEKPPVMVRLQVAFDRPLSGQGRLTGDNLGLKLRRILDDHSITQPDVSVDGGVVVLRGTATSESERLVLEKLIAIEPGVREVQNLMTVAQAPNG